MSGTGNDMPTSASTLTLSRQSSVTLGLAIALFGGVATVLIVLLSFADNYITGKEFDAKMDAQRERIAAIADKVDQLRETAAHHATAEVLTASMSALDSKLDTIRAENATAIALLRGELLVELAGQRGEDANGH